jgi:hypothetical protein
VTGSSSSVGFTGDSDYATIAYSGAGVPLGTNRHNGPVFIPGGAYSKSSLAIASDGALYVAGASEDGLVSSDFVTVKYVWRPEIEWFCTVSRYQFASSRWILPCPAAVVGRY